MGTHQPYIREKLTPERKEAFLRALRASGSRTWSAKQASPHCRGNPLRTFIDEMDRDETFREEVEAALALAHDEIRSEVHRRAIVGIEQRIYQKAQQVFNADGSPATIRVYSDRLLEIMARTLPEYMDRKVIDANLNVNVQNAEPAYRITKNDIYFLSPEQRKSLASIVLAISKSRGDVVDATPIESMPSPVIAHHPIIRDPWEDNSEDSENE